MKWLLDFCMNSQHTIFLEIKSLKHRQAIAMPAVNNEHNQSVRDFWLRLLCDSHKMSKEYIHWEQLEVYLQFPLNGTCCFQIQVIYCYKLIVTGGGEKENRTCSQKQTNTLYYISFILSVKTQQFKLLFFEGQYK
jgi:hypothetical protein